jgi:uncharacterized protein (DUF885 family)
MRSCRSGLIWVCVLVSSLLLLLLLSGCSSTQWGSWTSPTLNDVRKALRDLPFDQYVDTSYRLYLLRFPQTITEEGLAEAFGVRDDRLNDYSPAYISETQAIEREILDGLERFDRATLTAEQQVTYDTALWMWQDRVAQQDLEFSGWAIGSDEESPQVTLYDRLIAGWRIQTVDDVEDYIACLHQAGRQLDQIRSALLEQARQGIVPPPEVLGRILVQVAPLRVTETFSDCEYLPAHIVGGHHPYYTMLRARVLEILATNVADRVSYLQDALRTLEKQVIPAYERLYKSVTDLYDDASIRSVSVAGVPGGEAYYAWRLQHVTGLDLVPEELHQQAAASVEQIQAQIADLESESAGPSVPEAMDESLGGDEVRTEVAGLIEQAQVGCESAFDLVPARKVDVILADVGQGYIPASLGGARPARLVLDAYSTIPASELRELVYYDTYPGHQLQLETARLMDLPLVQTVGEFSGFSSGWSAYGQQLGAELGLLAENPHGELGVLRAELRQAALAAVDTGIQTLGWDYETAMQYYIGVTAATEDEASSLVKAAISRPAAAVADYVGSEELRSLRSRVEETAGASFDLASFHRMILEHGFLPLSVLDAVVDHALSAASL